MREAVSNLIGNAIKFTPEHGTVSVSVTQEDGRPVIRVRDNGIGVEPGERDKIFQRFYRTASGHRVPGSGLGLSIASAIANLHDFDLRFDDNHPGAVFEMAGRRKIAGRPLPEPAPAPRNGRQPPWPPGTAALERLC